MVEKFNYKHNCQIEMPDDYINGQGKGQISKMKYGLYSMGWNGCEMIAIYNAMRDLGLGRSIQDICLEMYPKSSVAVGFFGSNPLLLDKYFKIHNVPYTETRQFNRFFNELPNNQCGIASFFNHRPIFSSLHTVMVKNVNGQIVVYNKSNGKTEPVPLDFRGQLTRRSRFIVGYLFPGKEEK